MRLERQPFARLLATVTKATEHRNTIPVLATVRLVGTDGMIAATATNLDVEMTGSIEADTTEPFVGCIDAKLLTAAVNKVGGTEITLAQDGGRAILTAGRATYKLPVLSIDDFPTMDVGKFDAEFEANPAALLGDVAFSMSDEQQRVYLNGVYLQPTAATATNGHKLATTKIDGLPDFMPVIVPSKTVGLMPKVTSKVRLSATKIQFVADGVTLTSRLVDGVFPDYERVIPQNNDRLVRVDSAALKAAVERIAIVSKEAAPGAKLVISNDEIALSVHGDGEATDIVPCAYESAVTGPDYEGPLTIGFATHYLAEVLSALPAGEITMALADAGSPALFTSEQAPGMRIVLMPRRV